VKCEKSSEVINYSCSFVITTIKSGVVTVRIHTNYYGADWYSDIKEVTVVEKCTKST